MPLSYISFTNLVPRVDNIAPPIASCLGDLLTLTLLALSSTALLYIPSPIPFLLLLSLLGLTYLAVRAASKNAEVKHLLWSGWTPLFGAMFISSGTGMVLEKFVKKYEGFGLMAVIISGGFHSMRSRFSALTVYTLQSRSAGLSRCGIYIPVINTPSRIRRSPEADTSL